MALTKAQVREILSAAGVTSENMSEAVDKIIDGHVASIEALREEVATYKADAEKLVDVQKELDGLKSAEGDNWQEKFQNEHDSFENYKKQIASEKAKAEKTQLYKDLLKRTNVDEKRIDAILKVTNLDDIKVKDGKLDDTEHLEELIKNEWSGFIVNTRTEGANVDTHLESSNGMTKEAFAKLSLSEQMAYANEHPEQVSGFYK